jgi:hypothetical protein
MRRSSTRLTVVSLHLLAGAAASLLIAATPAVMCAVGASTSRWTRIDSATAAAERASHGLQPAGTVNDGTTWIGFGAATHEIWCAGSRSSPLPHITILTSSSSGWPFRCLRGSATSLRFSGTAGPVLQVQSALVLADQRQTIDGPAAVLLPYQPIWPGLLGNIACWTAVSMAVHWLAAAIRRSPVRTGGGCRNCGYPLSPNCRCAECGTLDKSTERIARADTHLRSYDFRETYGPARLSVRHS